MISPWFSVYLSFQVIALRLALNSHSWTPDNFLIHLNCLASQLGSETTQSQKHKLVGILWTPDFLFQVKSCLRRTSLIWTLTALLIALTSTCDVWRLLNPAAWQRQGCHIPQTQIQPSVRVPWCPQKTYVHIQHINVCTYIPSWPHAAMELENTALQKTQSAPMFSFCPLSASSGRMSAAGKCHPARWVPSATGLRHSAVSGFSRVPSFPSCWHLDIRASPAATLQLLLQTTLWYANTHTHTLRWLSADIQIPQSLWSGPSGPPSLQPLVSVQELYWEPLHREQSSLPGKMSRSGF